MVYLSFSFLNNHVVFEFQEFVSISYDVGIKFKWFFSLLDDDIVVIKFEWFTLSCDDGGVEFQWFISLSYDDMVIEF